MKHQYEVGIIGGGLAGLCAAIQLAKKGHNVVLFEKNFYPYHKVCGEYISNESKPFLNELGINTSKLGLPEISNFKLSSKNGKSLEVKLPQGGFGVSRYFLDDKLADLALASGVILLQGTEVSDVEFIEKHDVFIIKVSAGEFVCKHALGSFGKRSKLDKKLNRGFVRMKKDPKNNFVGVKYHVKSPIEDDRIELHLFEEGYAGISRVEDGKSCFCYLTTANLLQKSGGDINEMEAKFLKQNPFLMEHLDSFEKLYAAPLTISNIEFGPKEQVKNHVIMLGDAAGLISPLSGNGMSMAMQASKLAVQVLESHLNQSLTRSQMENRYIKLWNKHFGKRVKNAMNYQNLFFNESLVSTVLSLIKPFPFIAKQIIRSTQGREF